MSYIFMRRSRLLALLAPLAWPFAADAHIQWFSQVDLSTQPSYPWDVMSTPAFMGLGLLALVVLALSGVADAWLTRLAPRHRLLERLHALDMRAGGLALLRWGMAAFFVANVAYFHDSPVILTPELKAASIWPDVLQVGIATALVLGRLRLAAGGLVLLFGYATMNYGLFHLSEYPVFLGIAGYLALAGAGPDWRVRATNLLRVSVALSLMWGGVEKWLFPQWIFPLLCGSGKALAMGLPPDFFIMASGFIEFCLAWLLIVGSTAGRVAALGINVVFVSAMPMFGWVDVIGHAPFMLALIVVGRSVNTLAPRIGHAAPRLQGLRWGAAFLGTLIGLPATYYVTHQLAYGRMHLAPMASDLAIALPILGVIVTWLLLRGSGARRAPRGA